ncbi:MAG: Fe-S protein assembly co-chaperone HscB [Acidobacteria bacterium]|nr:Fe-S protein assembly co-chaperone HscB [Acidobacteriota bacterium]
MDHFQLFGLKRRLSLDAAGLQERFYELSRECHPDRYARRPAGERQKAEQASALLNDAYRTLRDPISRAEYLLKQEGFDIGEQRGKDVPPELLEEVFELNMALEGLRGGDEDARGPLEEARRRFLEMRCEIDTELGRLFQQYDASGDAAILQQIRGVLNRRRYIRNLVQEVEKELAPSGQPAR